MPELIGVTPKILKAAPPPLGFYLRPGRSDHRELANLLLSGPQKFFGAVIDATLADRQKDLISQLLTARLDVILDPKTQQSSFEHAHRAAFAELPWGTEKPHTIRDFQELLGRNNAIQLAEFAVAQGFTQVMAPTHVISSPNDPWLVVDREMTSRLRAELDKRGGKYIPLIYSLAISHSAFKDPEQLGALVSSLAHLPINSLWIKVDGFGADAGALALTRAMDAFSLLRDLGIPVVADCVGGVTGLSLLAFGCIGGIAHGVTSGESFSTYRWRTPQKPQKKGGSTWRIYSPPLGISLTKKEANALFASSPRAKSLFGNLNTSACPRGMEDMMRNPLRAFVVQRADEVSKISAVPASMRAQNFLEQIIRPMTDRALSATQIEWKADNAVGLKLHNRLLKHRKHVEDIRIALGARAEYHTLNQETLLPATRISREGLPSAPNL